VELGHYFGPNVKMLKRHELDENIFVFNKYNMNYKVQIVNPK